MAEQGNAAAMREALEAVAAMEVPHNFQRERSDITDACYDLTRAIKKARAALAAPLRKGKWMNGRSYEYEYAYCSECGRMQWAGWDSHRQAEENIESFADDYRFCPGCGTEMDGGAYVK